MAKKIGLDTKKAKEFLMQKGERVGLGVAGILTLLVLVLGFLGISTRPPAQAGGHTTWAKAIEAAASDLNGKIQRSEPDPKEKTNPDDLIPKESVFALLPDWIRFFEESFNQDTKRRNPSIKRCANGREDIQMDYLLAAALRYRPEGRDKYYVIDASDRPASLALDCRRVVLVNAAFPVNAQLDEFVNALQAGDRAKLLAGPDAPRILGLEVYRTEFLSKDKEGKEVWSDPTPLYVWSEKENRTVLAKNLDDFMRQMVIDDGNAKHLAEVLGPNMATPLPRLATISGAPGRYPKLELKDIAVEDEPAPDKRPDKGPIDNGGFKKFLEKKGPQGKPEKEPLDPTTTTAKAPEELLERMTHGNFNVFDPLATVGAVSKPEKDNKGDKKKKVKGKQQPPPPPKENPGKEAEKKQDGLPITQEDAKVLLRFFDVDVEPGKKYSYHFRVRIANPNFGKSAEVTALEYSKLKELPPDRESWTSTAPITIPQESFYYAVDQFELGKMTGKKPPLVTTVMKESIDFPNANHNLAEMTPVQIHRWISRLQAVDNSERWIGDWVIAERLLIKRGELMGRKKVIVDVPEWYENKNRFDWGKFAVAKHSGKFTPVDFLTDESKIPMLVDFQGPKKAEDGATELLVLEPNGKLTVRNSRVDSDPQSEVGKERLRHYNQWRRRVEELRRGSKGGGGTSPFPGGKGPG